VFSLKDYVGDEWGKTLYVHFNLSESVAQKQKFNSAFNNANTMHVTSRVAKGASEPEAKKKKSAMTKGQMVEFFFFFLCTPFLFSQKLAKIDKKGQPSVASMFAVKKVASTKKAVPKKPSTPQKKKQKIEEEEGDNVASPLRRSPRNLTPKKSAK